MGHFYTGVIKSDPLFLCSNVGSGATAGAVASEWHHLGWGCVQELEAKNCFQRQPWTKYSRKALVFV